MRLGRFFFKKARENSKAKCFWGRPEGQRTPGTRCQAATENIPEASVACGPSSFGIPEGQPEGQRTVGAFGAFDHLLTKHIRLVFSL